MTYRDLLAEVDFNLRRDSPYSYVCNACNRCCHNKAIRVGPYEALRLSRRLGITTTEFFTRHTEAGGTVLQTREDDRGCVFLGPRGCTVHPDRPARMPDLSSRALGEPGGRRELRKPAAASPDGRRLWNQRHGRGLPRRAGAGAVFRDGRSLR